MSSAVGRPALILFVAVIVASGVALMLRALDARRAPPIVITDIAAERSVTVVIDGAVATPGVLTLPPGARLNDAVIRAGGFLSSAESTDLNLARLLVDGERVTVARVEPAAASSTIEIVAGVASPAVRESPDRQPVSQPSAPVPSIRLTPTPPAIDSFGLVDINSATAAELDELPRIGPVLAERIVTYREENGPYGSVEELESVDGISTNTVDDLRPLITAGAGRS
jgi:competence protein ComEA